ncbi:hypothetical protein V1508DRAFT_432520 [Lipomyces doorenjongii]|uniref:uncharacterized protein n=1 Tax=Lipomyces doorenjongii TaxID=383834 RepID=UPI0034CEFDF0
MIGTILHVRLTIEFTLRMSAVIALFGKFLLTSLMTGSIFHIGTITFSSEDFGDDLRNSSWKLPTEFSCRQSFGTSSDKPAKLLHVDALDCNLCKGANNGNYTPFCSFDLWDESLHWALTTSVKWNMSEHASSRLRKPTLLISNFCDYGSRMQVGFRLIIL